jgi:hypothetical protein
MDASGYIYKVCIDPRGDSACKDLNSLPNKEGLS